MATTKSSRGGRGGGAQKYEQYLLSFAGSEISSHLRHVDADRAEVVEGLVALLYDGVDGRVSRMDLERFFIALGGDVVVGGGLLGLGLGGEGSDSF